MPIITAGVIFELLKLILYSEAFHCYNCASTLPSNISKDAQRAFKMVLYSTYLVPPVDKLCTNPEDVEFRTVKQITCPLDDQCIKITVRQKELQFIMRGCQSTIYRDKMIANDVECYHHHSPSICRCNSNLCNSSSKFSVQYYISLFTFLIILSNFS